MLKPAIEIAKTVIGATAPNPPVGAAGYDIDGNFLGVGVHRQAGLLHAEADLIATLQKKGKIHELHTLAVTLEPCSHTDKKTPPCVNALLEIPTLKKVWVGCQDPNPKVQGAGLQRLRDEGIEVELASGEEKRECERLIAPFWKWIQTKLPWVVVKQAWRETMPGEMSMIPEPGQKTFTSAAALTLAHQIRKESDAILTTTRTVLADDPEFTIRHVQDHRVLKPRLLVILGDPNAIPRAYLEQAKRRGFLVHSVTGPDLHQALNNALILLGKQGCLQVLVEAGPTLSNFVLSGSFWDESVVIKRLKEGSESTAHVYRNR